MPEWLTLQEPFVRTVATGAVCMILIIVAVHIWQRRREAVAEARRRAERQRTYGQLQVQQRELTALAGQVVATSSTATIAGFEIVRQIEAVFAEGQRSPAAAVELLKALAAKKGANALINLSSQRLPSGKCVASGDAVVVRPLGDIGAGPPGGAAVAPMQPHERTTSTAESGQIEIDRPAPDHGPAGGAEPSHGKNG